MINFLGRNRWANRASRCRCPSAWADRPSTSADLLASPLLALLVVPSSFSTLADSSQARPHPGAIQSIIASSPFLSALASAPAVSSTPSKAASSPAPSSSSSGKPVDYEDDMLIPRHLLLGGYRIEDAEMDAVMVRASVSITPSWLEIPLARQSRSFPPLRRMHPS